MSGGVGRSDWLRLYRELLRAAGGFQQYNFRETARRRVRDHFRRSYPADQDPVALYQKGKQELEVRAALSVSFVRLRW